jgi:hypothetical protein
MELKENIKIYLINKSQSFIETLIEYFKELPEVTLIQGELNPQKIKSSILECKPEVLLIDIERLSDLVVVEFEEIIHSLGVNFKVVLYCTYKIINVFETQNIKTDLDLISSNDLKLIVKGLISSNIHSKFSEDKNLIIKPINNKFIAFQTLIGLRFIDKKCIVYFEYTKDEKSDKRLWEAYLDNSEVIKLKLNTSSKDIMKHFENHDFIQISQSNIINMKFFSSIELKSRKCILHSPYDEKEMIISRAYLSELKNKFEID